MSTAAIVAAKQIPIVCPGHTRPLAELHYVCIENDHLDADTKNANNRSSTSTTTLLLSAFHDKMPMLRDGRSGDWIGTWVGHKGAVWSCQMDPTGCLAATASGDYSARVWDAITGQSLVELPHKHIVKTCGFSPNSRRLATGGKEASLRIYELPNILIKQQNNDKMTTGNNIPAVEIIQESPVSKLSWISDHLVLCGCMNGKIYLWRIANNEMPTASLVHVFETSEGAEVRDMEFQKEQMILTVASGTKVYFFDMKQPYKLIKNYTMPVHFKEEGGCTLHPTSGKIFVAGGSDLWVRVFDYETGKELECHKGHHGPIRCVRFSPDGESYASGSEDGTIRLWKTSTL